MKLPFLQETAPSCNVRSEAERRWGCEAAPYFDGNTSAPGVGSTSRGMSWKASQAGHGHSQTTPGSG